MSAEPWLNLILRKIGRFVSHIMVLVVLLVVTVVPLPNIAVVRLVALIFKRWWKVSCKSRERSQIAFVSETELEKNNNLGKCCEFLKVDSGLTYSGTYELNKGMIYFVLSHLPKSQVCFQFRSRIENILKRFGRRTSERRWICFVPSKTERLEKGIHNKIWRIFGSWDWMVHFSRSWWWSRLAANR